jgi:hypothetical protein
MKKQNLILSTALAAIFSSSVVMAEAEVTGKFVHESAQLSSGTNTGIKSESTVRIYIDGDAEGIAEGATYHVELQGYDDSKANHSSSAAYTQRDPLREAYVDMELGDLSIRAGKQQVVWGTADGMKLLDMINPTDYAEMAQNQMEDSRIPVWAINLEQGSVQAVISQPKENVFAGLNRGTATDKRQNDPAGADLTTNNGTDTGNAFVMMGPDSITGEVNGFLNIVPDLASVAGGFSNAFAGPGITNFKHFTVDMFAGMSNQDLKDAGMNGFAAMANAIDNNGMDGTEILAAFSAAYNTSLTESESFNLMMAGQAFPDSGHLDWGVNKDTAFEYMGSATFATFDAFAGASSEYRYNMPASDDVDFAIKTSQTTKSGVNYSLNFSNSYDKNPIIDISWIGENDEALHVNPLELWWVPGQQLPVAAGTAGAYPSTTLTLNTEADGSGQAYGFAAMGAAAGTSTATNSATPANLVFEQSVVKTNNFGGSFDTSFEHSSLGPVVIRGETLYTQGGKQPVVDKALFAIGDLPGALTMLDADRFKFVLGVDITVLTNMLVSTQYISDRNLDFIDGDKDTGKYSTDYATMHLSNGFNKAIKNKQYGSLFFSKPFGESGQHRWNNITMLEEGVGENAYWNRFDIDYSIDDDTQATLEYNKYWGNVNTQFGQLKNASNIQVGVKYSF